jgi:hypothetical protein
MFTAVAFLAVLGAAPGQANTLALSDVRISAGIQGVTRPQTKFLPGDSLFVSFEIDGITIDDTGKVRYSTSTEITDSKGKVVFRGPTRDLEALAMLGGAKLPAYAQVDIGLDQPPGDYAVKVTVTDLATKKSQALTQKFGVLPKGFGVVRPTLTCDPEGQIPTGIFIPGQSLWLNFLVVGFARDAKRQPHVTFEMRILDDKGQPTVAQPFTGKIQEGVPASANALPAQFLLALNRAGQFTLVMKATDQVTGKKIEGSYPFTVQPRK